MKEDLHPEANEEVTAALNEFSHSSFTLARLLQRGVTLTDIERLSIENNLAIVQLHYSVWVGHFSNK